MRRALGPIFTTGVALTAAGVVVANPVIPPRSDVQIPAVQLSAGAGDALGMLDEDFLNAIAPAPPQSTNPFVILKDLITSLAADATYLGKSAIVDAFVAGATAVTQPELTASSYPYVPQTRPAPSSDLAPAQLDPAALNPLSLESVLPVELGLPTADLSDLSPVMAEAVTSMVNDVSYVSNQLVTAAFAAGAMLAAEPALIVGTLWALVEGDVRGALETAVAAVSAPFAPSRIVLDALHTVITRHLPGAPAAVAPEIEPPAAPETEPSAPVETPEPGTTSPLAAEADRVTTAGPRQRRAVIDPPAVVLPVAAVPAEVNVPAEVQEQPDTPGAGRGETEQKPSVRRSGALGRAVTGVVDQAGTALRDTGDAVRQATGRPARVPSEPSDD